ncbi:MAG: TonB-dependent receptor [Prevotella sp.]|jgi:TonB-dependent receptor
MNKIISIVSLVVALFCCNLHAEPVFDEEGTSLGNVRGRVVNAEKEILPGASIYVEDVKVGVVSDVNGFYTIPNLKPGKHTIKITYVGYNPKEITINVPSGTIEEDIELTDGTELKSVQVVGVFSGTRKALSMQKNAMGIMNVVSADQVGKFPDSNIGDALKRINGINVQYDQGEARFGQIRGTSADLTSVTINGDRLPASSADTRSIQLDIIPADMVQTIEVSKVVTSDMDGDAIGGSINLVTKNTPYHRVLSFSGGTGYNWISEKPQWNLAGTWGDRFFNKKLGIMLSASYQYAPGGSDNTEFVYELGDDNKIELNEAQVRQYYVTRERQSYSGSFDFKFDENNSIAFKAMYNRRNDFENRYRLSYKKLNGKAKKQNVALQLKGGSNHHKGARLERQQTMDFALNGDHQWGIVKVDWSSSFSRASESKPDERYASVKYTGTYNGEAYGDHFVDVGGEHPYCDLAIPDINDEGWEVSELTDGFEKVFENEWKFKANVKLPLISEGDFANTLKFGGKYTTKHKHYNVKSLEYDGDYISDWRDHLYYSIRDGFMAGDNYPENTPFFDKHYIGGLDMANMDGTHVLADEAKSYKALENIAAGYIRFDQKLGHNLFLTAGLRVENTHLKTSGVNYMMDADENESLAPTGEYKHDYTDWLPSILLKYRLGEDGNVRASYTKTISRPKYSALIANKVISIADEEATIGDPNIEPSKSDNLDFSIDYYFKSIGLVSAGIFYKNVKNVNVEAIGTMTGAELGLGGDYATTDFQVTQNMNAYDAHIFGVEVAFQRDFSFISPALKCVGFYGNYTYTHSSTRNYNPLLGIQDDDDVKMAGSPEHTGNASLYFDKWGFNLRLSYNAASSFIDAMNLGSRELDRYYDNVNYMDLNASYTWGKDYKFTIYANATNLLNQPLRYYQGTNDRTMQVEYYGVKCNVGFKIDF